MSEISEWLDDVLDDNTFEVTTKFVDRIDVLLNQTMPEFIRMTVTQTGKDYHSNMGIKQYKNILKSYHRIEDSLGEREKKELNLIMYAFTTDFFEKITQLRNKEINADRIRFKVNEKSTSTS